MPRRLDAARCAKARPGSTLSALKDAEETLLRLRTRQKQIDATAAAMAEMEQSGDPAAVSEKLAAAGCGAPLRSSADAVLERLTEDDDQVGLIVSSLKQTHAQPT